MALYEVFWVNAAVRRMVLDGADGDTIRQHAIEAGMMTLRQAGFRRALQGHTTVEEVMAVVADQE
jgi:general secretion pathway protein E